MKKGILFPCDVLEQFPCIFPCERGKCQGCPIIAAKRNVFKFPHLHDSAFYDCNVWITFWDLCELEWAEQQKKQELYDPGSNPCGGDPCECNGDCDNCTFNDDYLEFEEDEE